MQDVELMEPDTYIIYDGAHTDDDCSDISKLTFSANNGLFTYGAAVMYNFVSVHPPVLSGSLITGPAPFCNRSTFDIVVLFR